MFPVAHLRRALLVAGLALVSLQPATASAQTIVVTTLADSGAGSLREAIAAANLDGVPTTITFAPGLAGGTIALQSELPLSTRAALRSTAISTTTACPTSRSTAPEQPPDRTTPASASARTATRPVAWPSTPSAAPASRSSGAAIWSSAAVSGRTSRRVRVWATPAPALRSPDPAPTTSSGPATGFWATVQAELPWGTGCSRVSTRSSTAGRPTPSPSSRSSTSRTPMGRSRASTGSGRWTGRVRPCLDEIGLRLSGTLTVTAPGTYTIAVDVDDQVRIVVDGEVVHSANNGQSTVEVALGGAHAFEVDFLEGCGWAHLVRRRERSGHRHAVDRRRGRRGLRGGPARPLWRALPAASAERGQHRHGELDPRQRLARHRSRRVRRAVSSGQRCRRRRQGPQHVPQPPGDRKRRERRRRQLRRFGHGAA